MKLGKVVLIKEGVDETPKMFRKVLQSSKTAEEVNLNTSLEVMITRLGIPRETAKGLLNIK